MTIPKHRSSFIRLFNEIKRLCFAIFQSFTTCDTITYSGHGEPSSDSDRNVFFNRMQQYGQQHVLAIYARPTVEKKSLSFVVPLTRQ